MVGIRAVVFIDAIVDHEVEFIVVSAQAVRDLRGAFRTIVPVVNPVVVDVLLGEGGAYAQRCGIEIQPAMCRHLRNAVLPLYRGVVRVDGGQMSGVDQYPAAFRHVGQHLVRARERSTARDGAADRGIGIARFVGDHWRVVDRQDVDDCCGRCALMRLRYSAARHGRRDCARIDGKGIGRFGQIVAHHVVEFDFRTAGITQRLAAIVLVAQAGGRAVGRGRENVPRKPFAGLHRDPGRTIPAFERSMGGQGGCLKP